MKIQSLFISGFRCIGPVPVHVDLSSSLPTLVGANGSGKTTILHALAKLFGITRAQRTITRDDFHVPSGVDPDVRTEKSLFIEVLIGLPELADSSTTSSATVAPMFKHMAVASPGGAPLCRMRLEARWVDDGTVDGEVIQRLDWITTLGLIDDDHRHSVSPSDRGLIQLHYTPASRDAAAQIRASTGALAARLLRAIEWSAATQTQVEAASYAMQNAFTAEGAISAIKDALTTRWLALNADAADSQPSIVLTSRRFEEIVRNIGVVFQQTQGGFERGLNMLSDGQQSLFYFALAAAVFDVERQASIQAIGGFDSTRLSTPALTIFAIEEPENHLAPHYLARIIEQVRSLIRGYAAQAILTSHSPSVLGRVAPEEVRYCRRDLKTGASYVKRISLPQDDVEAVKFVRGAMLAYPELYFAKFVVLGEGDSEQIVLPRLARALQLNVDTSFVAIVPLGGRHIHHFWRLLRELDIPHATLLDLDIGRSGGGFGRIKTAVQQLLKNGANRNDLVGNFMSDGQIDEMHNWDQYQHLPSWLDCLERHGVFFANPLDLDMEMLAAYPMSYAALIPAGRGPELTVDEAAIAVLSKGGIAKYVGSWARYAGLLPYYKYHFLSHSKPATHLRALSNADDAELLRTMPLSLRRLLTHVNAHLGQS